MPTTHRLGHAFTRLVGGLALAAALLFAPSLGHAQKATDKPAATKPATDA